MIVYCTENLITGKLYVGQTIRNDNNYLGGGIIINNAIEKYGKENFKRIILVECSSQKELNEQEIFWIKELNTLDPNGYNLELGGNGAGRASEKTKRLMSESSKGESNPSYGKTLEEIHKPNCQCCMCKNKRGGAKGENNLMFGKQHTEKTKQQISESLKGENHPNYGKTLEEIGHKSDCQCCVCKAKRGETKGKSNLLYNKSYEEIYGIEKAKELRKQRGEAMKRAQIKKRKKERIGEGII